MLIQATRTRVSRRCRKNHVQNLLIGQCVKLKFRDIKVTLNIAGLVSLFVFF